MSAANAIYFTAGSVALMVLVVALIAVMVLLDSIAAAPVRPKPRHRRSLGQQMWVRSVETDTVAIAVHEGRWSL